jgi:hypothetical protein
LLSRWKALTISHARDPAMTAEQFFMEAPLWTILLLLFVLMGVAREAGAWARRAEGRVPRKEGEATDEGYILTAVLGLLALLVAFSFGMSLNRYEARRELVVSEANAIGTAYLRSAVLDDPAKLRGLLLQYAQARLEYGEVGGAAQAAELEADQLQPQVWAEAVRQVAPRRDTPLAGFVLSPLGDAFDAASERKAELQARMPLVVLVTLSVYFVAAAAVLGYASAHAEARHRLASFALFGLFLLALGVILDLDRPRGGLIHLPQGAMIDTVAMIRASAG